MFLRKTKAREPLPVTMSGVRMGERLLQVGVDDPAFAGALAAKVGLSGHAAIAVSNDLESTRANSAAANSGALVDITTSSLEALPYADASFDVVIVHALRTPIGETGVTTAVLEQCRRVLRPGGRIVVITPGPKTGLGALLTSSAVPASDSAPAALGQAGFRPVRVVGELEGLRFTEGMSA